MCSTAILKNWPKAFDFFGEIMKRYFRLQLKRIMKTAPLAVALCLILALGFGLILNGVSAANDSKNTAKSRIAIAGDLDNTFISMGITALSDFDTLSYSIEVVSTDTETAAKMLRRGELDAYVVIPEGFAEKAAYGEFLPLTFVTIPGDSGIVPIIKEEITKVISHILTCSHKGVYGLNAAMNGTAGKHMNDLAFEYVDVILERSNMFTIENLGVAYSLSLSGYFFCGLFTVLLFLLGIAFAHLFVRRETTLGRILAAKDIGALKQTVGEFLSLFAVYFAITFLAVFAARISGVLSKVLPFTDRLDAFEMLGVYFKLIPSVLLVSAFCFAVYEFSTNTVSAVLFQFIFTVLIGYASGCIFPVWFFPEVLQKIAPFTPIGAARGYFAACFTGEDFGLYLALCLGFAALFFGLALLRRRQRILGKSEVAVW